MEENVQFHRHNGVDSPKIDYNDLKNLPSTSTIDRLYYLFPNQGTLSAPLRNPNNYAYDNVNNKLYLIGSSNNTDTMIYRYDIVANNQVRLNSGNDLYPYWTLKTSYDFPGQGGYCDGTYLYIWARKISNTTWYLLRIAVADGTTTEMTISGTAPDQDEANTLFGYGTTLYILDNLTTTVRTYTISGTTATHGADITLPDNGTSCIVTNGTNIWFVTDDAGNTRDYNLYKTTMAGVTVSNEYLLEARFSGFNNNASLIIYNDIVHWIGAIINDTSAATVSKIIKPLVAI